MEEAKRHLFWAGTLPPPFIRSTGQYQSTHEVANNGSCISTGVYPSATVEVELVVRVTPGGPSVHWPYLLGAQGSNDSADTCGIRGNGYQNTQSTNIGRPWAMFRWGHSGYTSIGNGNVGWSTTEDWHCIRVSKKKLEVDGVSFNATQSENSNYSSYPLVIGSINRAGQHPNCIPHDLALVKVWSNGVLVRDMVPVVKDNVAGMYDNATGQFFSSAVSSWPYHYFVK